MRLVLATQRPEANIVTGLIIPLKKKVAKSFCVKFRDLQSEIGFNMSYFVISMDFEDLFFIFYIYSPLVYYI